MYLPLKIVASLMIGVPLILANIFFYVYFSHILNLIAAIVLTISMVGYIGHEIYYEELQ